MEKLIVVRAADENIPVRLVDLSGWIGTEPVEVVEHPDYVRARADGDLEWGEDKEWVFLQQEHLIKSPQAFVSPVIMLNSILNWRCVPCQPMRKKFC